MSIKVVNTRTYVLGSLVATLGLALLVAAAELFGFGSFGFEFAALSAFAVILLGLGWLAALWRGTRSFARPAIAVGLVPLLLVYPSLALAKFARNVAFARLADRSSLLISAIQTYEKRHGTPPPNLAALVPEELPKIPSTGMRAYPRYVYARSDASAPRWELSVPCSTGGINADTFVYWPEENYPSTNGAGDFERIGRWAYLHE